MDFWFGTYAAGEYIDQSAERNASWGRRGRVEASIYIYLTLLDKNDVVRMWSDQDKVGKCLDDAFLSSFFLVYFFRKKQTVIERQD